MRWKEWEYPLPKTIEACGYGTLRISPLDLIEIICPMRPHSKTESLHDRKTLKWRFRSNTQKIHRGQAKGFVQTAADFGMSNGQLFLKGSSMSCSRVSLSINTIQNGGADWKR
jgi:hypothetical protein